MLYKRLIINGTEYLLAVGQSGKGAPTETTPGAVGVTYLDTDTEALYKCTGAENGVCTWAPAEGSGGAAIDPTLTQSGQAADASVVGQKFGELSEEMLTDAELRNAVDDALAQAKESGEFDGAKGDPGVGIQSVVQTTTSTEDGGDNIVTVTKTDGTTSTFEVRNGSKGSTPKKGTDYWTAEDQQAIVDDVLAVLPTWEGGSY